MSLFAFAFNFYTCQLTINYTNKMYAYFTILITITNNNCRSTAGITVLNYMQELFQFNCMTFLFESFVYFYRSSHHDFIYSILLTFEKKKVVIKA